jgi:hypothetical protein
VRQLFLPRRDESLTQSAAITDGKIPTFHFPSCSRLLLRTDSADRVKLAIFAPCLSLEAGESRSAITSTEYNSLWPWLHHNPQLELPQAHPNRMHSPSNHSSRQLSPWAHDCTMVSAYGPSNPWSGWLFVFCASITVRLSAS